MRDPNLDRLARVLVHYSTAVKPGQLVRLSGDPVGLPLLEAIHEELILAGAHVDLRMMPDTMQEFFLGHASDEQLKYVSPIAAFTVEKIDASISLWAETNTRSMTGIDPARQAMAAAAREPIMNTFMQRAAEARLRWVGTLYPTAASAQDAEMSLRDYEKFVFQAGYLDREDPVAIWRDIAARQEKLVARLNQCREVRFRAANGTDVTVDVQGMKWISCAGESNFPDGEVFTGPNLTSARGGVNGYVRFSFPAVHHGREVTDIELWFENGRVVKCHASRNEDFLKRMLATDEGASRVGEVAIGTNYNISQYTRNTLFDEKIGGTFHMAVGAGYPETGNTNRSGLHWDMVCDLRQGGEIEADGQIISRDGRFTDPDWPAPVA
ncbi:MAG: aminopeptidase [Phycisphaeraceae bacterium]|nr:aminopeptidase [Phycisphaeraceae bacterium]